VSHFIVTFSYGVDGIHHNGEFHSSNEWKEGTEICVLYNPQNPEENSVCDDDCNESRGGAAIEFILGMLMEGVMEGLLGG
jgi:hypothetical protein